MNYTHLLYIWKYDISCNDYVFEVCGVNTKDIFHTMGEIYYRSIESIKRINFVKLNDKNRQAKIDYWKNQNVPIKTYSNKYSYHPSN